MEKREFLKLTSVAGAGLVLAPSLIVSCSVDPKTSKKKYWVWTNVDKEATDDELREKFGQLKSHGITGLLIGGDDERNYTIARELGLETHIWWWTMNRRDEFIMENHPEWYAINRLGESCHDKPPYVDYYRWLCPSKAAVQEYLKEQAIELAKKPYIDGVHLDYVRYCDVILPEALWPKYGLVQDHEMPEFDYCYCDTCRDKFKAKGGEDPLEMEDPPSNQQWLEYRYDSITQVVNMLSAAVHGTGKKISAAVFPTPTIAKKLVRQDWVKWNLDMIFPMVYQGFYNEPVEWVGKAVAEGVTALDGKFPLYAGLYMPDLPNPEDLANAVKFSGESGAEGSSIFAGVSDEHWSAFEKAIALQK
jgi:uncharacterized lipoprotein YddW (UPF0748 family)